MKSFENVSCNVIECESLEEQLRRIDDLCAKVGAGWTVDVNYSVAKGMLVCGIYSEWPECNCLHDGKTLDEVEVILREIREKKREHQKKDICRSGRNRSGHKRRLRCSKPCRQRL